MRLTAQTVMGNGPTAVSEFKNRIARRVELENRYGSLAHREFESLPLGHTLNCPGFGGGCILWEDVAHVSIEAADAQAWIGTPASS